MHTACSPPRLSCLFLISHKRYLSSSIAIMAETTFLFTSESVNEGHPGTFHCGASASASASWDRTQVIHTCNE